MLLIWRHRATGYTYCSYGLVVCFDFRCCRARDQEDFDFLRAAANRAPERFGSRAGGEQRPALPFAPSDSLQLPGRVLAGEHGAEPVLCPVRARVHAAHDTPVVGPGRIKGVYQAMEPLVGALPVIGRTPLPS